MKIFDKAANFIWFKKLLPSNAKGHDDVNLSSKNVITGTSKWHVQKTSF